MEPGGRGRGYLFDCCALSDFDACRDELLELAARSVAIASPQLVLAEWPALDLDRCTAMGLTVLDESDEQLLEIAAARRGLSLADRAALTLARDGPYVLVTNDAALHRIAGREGVERIWGPELLAVLVARGSLSRDRAFSAVRAMRVGKTGSAQPMTQLFVRQIRRATRVRIP